MTPGNISPNATQADLHHEANSVRNAGFRISAILTALLWLLWTPTVVGQMGTSVTYSDQWLDTSNPMNVKVRAAGVTQDNTNSYGHTYWVITTQTSPSGRTTTLTSSQSSSYSAYARAETYLTYATADGSLDLGEFDVVTQHKMCCPFMGGNPQTGFNCISSSTSIPILVGASITVLTKAAMSNIYTKITNCNVHCPVDQFIASQNEGQYIICVVPWVYFGGYQCAPVSLNYKASPFDNCVDVQGWVPIPGTPF